MKVTDGFAGNAEKRRLAANRLVELLVAIPLFTSQHHTVFHADPHAGNLYLDENTGEMIIFDWALTETLSFEQRRQLFLLMLAVLLRDEQNIYNAIAGLSKDDLTTDHGKAQIVRRHVAEFIRQLSPFMLAGLSEFSSLLNDLLFAGIQLATPILMFRKALFTLEGVLGDIEPDLQMELVVAQFILKQRMMSIFGNDDPNSKAVDFALPLSLLDFITLNLSLQTFILRVGMQTVRCGQIS
ncbi:AarF/UbiB family protein [Candidatus Entotheonella palauensis]|uniref:ABC1 atypical kinase-like domain-containing protein n=1 Tax=Candidatus Entotheonella gemina TaxID=1429439 RepID=W4LBN2_9BACT|nr:AarF/UbiB family protein [Candidatus Entotheonella palauensis]ETW95387.1 MAG: hypothetical protein ETSY2_48215 [Candidatus Entotheonella gemina]